MSEPDPKPPAIVPEEPLADPVVTRALAHLARRLRLVSPVLGAAAETVRAIRMTPTEVSLLLAQATIDEISDALETLAEHP